MAVSPHEEKKNVRAAFIYGKRGNLAIGQVSSGSAEFVTAA